MCSNVSAVFEEHLPEPATLLSLSDLKKQKFQLMIFLKQSLQWKETFAFINISVKENILCRKRNLPKTCLNPFKPIFTTLDFK